MPMFGGPIKITARNYTPGSTRKRKEEEEKPKSYWDGGDKFTGRDALAAGLAAIGDGLTSWANGPSAAYAGRSLIGGRMSAIEQARQAQAAQQQAAAERAATQRRRQAFIAAGGDPNMFDAAGGEVGKVSLPSQPKPGSFGWYQKAPPEDRALYDQYNPFVVSTGQGPVAVPRRPAIGSTVSMADLGGGAPQPTIQNTPPPELNANGMPTVLTRQQYEATVREMGKQQTDEWMRRNGIKVSN